MAKILNLYAGVGGNRKLWQGHEITAVEYDETIAKGDGSKIEDLSKTVNVDVKSLKNLTPSDTVTKLLIEEGKKYLNIS